METTRIQSNAVERVYFLLLDASGDAVTGLTGAQLNMLTLMRRSDGSYWSGVVWGEGSTSLAVIEQNSTESPGLYYYTTPTLTEDEYIVTVDTTYADNVPQIGQVKVGSYVDNLDDTISDKATSTAISALNNLSSQNVRDAMKLAPTAGDPVAGSIDKHLDDVQTKTDNLPSGVKKNTALASFTFFMRDNTNHATGKTGLTVTAERSIDGAAFAACSNSVVEIGSGVYKINLSATDMNGDVITLKFTATGADATVVTIVTEP